MSSFPVLVPAALGAPGLLLLDFWQASCAPCRALEPRLEQIARPRSGEFNGNRIDGDASPETARDFDVQSIPTLVLFRGGREVTRLDGLIHTNDVDEALDSYPPSTPSPRGTPLSTGGWQGCVSTDRVRQQLMQSPTSQVRNGHAGCTVPRPQGVATMPGRITGEARTQLAADLAAQYEQGTPIRSLAESSGRSYGFIHQLLTEAGVTGTARRMSRR